MSEHRTGYSLTRNNDKYLRKVSALYQEYILYDEEQKRDVMLAKSKQPRVIRFRDDIEAIEYCLWANGHRGEYPYRQKKYSIRRKRDGLIIHHWSKDDTE